MKDSQYSSSNHSQRPNRKKFGDAVTRELILACVVAVIMCGAAVYTLINWVT